jgi:acyl-CoA reductase-like NAD-dependent aldehyde dehydrogenase
MGNPTNPSCTLGPLISERQLNTVTALVDGAADREASILCGGKRLTGISPLDETDFSKGYYYPPTVLHDSDKVRIRDLRIWHEEVFGPVIVIVAFDTEEEALELANDSEFGLGAAVWTGDGAQGFRVADGIRAGIIWSKFRRD